MGEMTIPGRDEPVRWDPADKESVRAAYATFARLRARGFEFFADEAGTGRRLSRFDKKTPRIVAMAAE